MSFFYLFVCLALFAIGDILGVYTKAKVSSVFVALILFLVGFLTKIIPADIIDQAGLSQVAKWAAAYIVFHMGTMINWTQLKKEWRSVVLSVVAMGVAVISILIVMPIIGKQAVVVSIPIINGGIVATQIMTAAAMEKGIALAAALGTIIYAVQKFVGTPPASIFGLREANEIIRKYRMEKKAKEDMATTLEAEGGTEDEDSLNNKVKGKLTPFYEKYDKYFTNYTCLGVTAFFAWISKYLGSITPISYSIWALILGATIGFYGLVPPKILDKGKSSGFLSMALFASIIPSLAKIKLSDLGTLGMQTIVVFAAVLLGTYLFIYVLPLWKIVGSRNLAVGITMAQLLGFPATFLIANEIATAVAENEEEKEAVLNRIMPAYVVAGFASVTTISIIIAGIFVKFL